MGQLRRSGFVGGDTLTLASYPGHFVLSGEISCLGDIVITVSKVLEVLPGGGGPADPRVQTVKYAYNASVRGIGSVLRNDNAHRHMGHPDEHHRHEYALGATDEPPAIWCGEEGWPSLEGFIQQVSEWYYTHIADLPNADRFAALDLRSDPED